MCVWQQWAWKPCAGPIRLCAIVALLVAMVTFWNVDVVRPLDDGVFRYDIVDRCGILRTPLQTTHLPSVVKFIKLRKQFRLAFKAHAQPQTAAISAHAVPCDSDAVSLTAAADEGVCAAVTFGTYHPYAICDSDPDRLPAVPTVSHLCTQQRLVVCMVFSEACTRSIRGMAQLFNLLYTAKEIIEAITFCFPEHPLATNAEATGSVSLTMAQFERVRLTPSTANAEKEGNRFSPADAF